jgi:beta-xylosidase
MAYPARNKWLPYGAAALGAFFCCVALCVLEVRAQESDLEYTLDAGSTVIPLPDIFKPSIDLSGRGFHSDLTWPQALADRHVRDAWQKDIGLRSVCRLQYNLWEISEVAGNRALQSKLLGNYEDTIKRVSDSGGTVILNIFSTPQGQGKVLDKKSSPVDLKAFKAVVKEFIRYYSCVKRYTVWYEVWTAPDLDDFFIGRQQEYLNLYKSVAESVKELEAEFKITIPVGGPSSSWWFRGGDGNTNVTPERSLVYELIKFCYHYKLPLDFVSWHAYSTDPKTEKEMTSYNKSSVALMRDWLSYFNMERVLLIVDEWNYDNGVNLSSERRDRAFVSASYIPARLKNMYEAGIDQQVFFSLEDFQYNKEGIERNVGVFWFTPDPVAYNGGAKSIYNVFRGLSSLGSSMFVYAPKLADEFVGVIPTKAQDRIALLVYNYIDPDIFRNYLSRNIALLNEGERRALLSIIKSDKLDKILRRQLDAGTLPVSNRTKAMLKKAQELNDSAARYSAAGRNIKIVLKNLKEDYIVQRFTGDSACNSNCELLPAEIDQVVSAGTSSISLVLNPYSVNLVVLIKKSKEEAQRPQEIEKALEEAAKAAQPAPQAGADVPAETSATK